jgi:hypothetical protein
MDRKFLQRVISTVEPYLESRPSSAEFEMAYQMRVAIDRIRFAIKQVEQIGSTTAMPPEASLQLLDALDRLESADRNFQMRWRCGFESEGKGDHALAAAPPNNGSRTNGL